MRQLAIFLLGAVCGAFLLFVVSPREREKISAPLPFAQTARTTSITRAGAVTTPPIRISNASSPDTVRVTRAVDGDTIEIEGGERVRYIGIDTPETMHPRKPVQCFSREAAAKNKELVEGKQVRLARDISDRDRYGRLLRYVYADNLFINLELVREGYARAATFPPDVAHAEEFLAAEQEARAAGKGLWSMCK